MKDVKEREVNNFQLKQQKTKATAAAATPDGGVPKRS